VNIKEELRGMRDRLQHLFDHHLEHDGVDRSDLKQAVGAALNAVGKAHDVAPADLEGSIDAVPDPNAPVPDDTDVERLTADDVAEVDVTPLSAGITAGAKMMK
jgi:hypothetical protein